MNLEKLRSHIGMYCAASPQQANQNTSASTSKTTSLVPLSVFLSLGHDEFIKRLYIYMCMFSYIKHHLHVLFLRKKMNM